VRDITGLQEYKKLKSDTVSLISHELRTPITSINGFSELLSLEDDIPESAREYVTIISNEAQRLSRMIDTFLSVTKLEQKDKEEVIKVPVKLDEIVKDVLLNMQHLARSRRIRLFEQSTGRIPPVAADRGLITKVITNLVDNAIRYSPERTNVIVSTTLEIDYVRVTVEDQGYGIPPESLDKVWEKFYRVAREGMDKEEKSTGLGLTFVKEVIEQHGGGVSVMSEVGKGSVFSIALPRL
jgi:two-component system phosphate regulon sensor histidine kinase PhoR